MRRNCLESQEYLETRRKVKDRLMPYDPEDRIVNMITDLIMVFGDIVCVEESYKRWEKIRDRMQ